MIHSTATLPYCRHGLSVVQSQSCWMACSSRLDLFCYIQYKEYKESLHKELCPIPLKAFFGKALCLRRGYSSPGTKKLLFTTSTQNLETQKPRSHKLTYPLSGGHPYCDVTMRDYDNFMAALINTLHSTIQPKQCEMHSNT